MNDELNEKPKPDILIQPDEKSESGSSLKSEMDQASVNEGSLPKSPSRFRVFLKRMVILLVLLLVVFAAGWLTNWQLKFRPTSVKLTDSEADLLTAKQQIAELENKLAILKDIEQEKLLLQDAYNDNRMHVALLRLLSDFNAARLALVDEDPASARLYLKPTPERLVELEEYLGPAHAEVISNMQKRLVLIDAEISSDPATALTDLSVLANHLLQIEGVFFAVP